mgnify:CR=1 FL=1
MTKLKLLGLVFPSLTIAPDWTIAQTFTNLGVMLLYENAKTAVGQQKQTIKNSFKIFILDFTLSLPFLGFI